MMVLIDTYQAINTERIEAVLHNFSYEGQEFQSKRAYKIVMFSGKTFLISEDVRNVVYSKTGL